jgi:hypothetical protein
MKCYVEDCFQEVKWFIFIDASVACDEHAPADYSEELQ